MTQTEREALIAQLLAPGCPDWVTARHVMKQASDMLEAQTKQIVELEKERDEYQQAADTMAAAHKVERDGLREALLNIARKAEMLKKECGDDPESPQAIRNGRYMSLSYLARAAVAQEPIGCIGKDSFTVLYYGDSLLQHGTEIYAAPVAPAQPAQTKQVLEKFEPLTDEQIEALVHSTATKYTHRSDRDYHSYGFVRHTLIDFVRKVEKHIKEKA